MTTCTHCNGTSLCQFSVIREQRQGLPCLYCETCGVGTPGVFGFFRRPHMRPPVCKVCGGKGHVIPAAPNSN